MKRRVTQVAFALSLALVLATAALHVRGAFATDQWSWERVWAADAAIIAQDVSVVAERGRIGWTVMWDRFKLDGPTPAPGSHFRHTTRRRATRRALEPAMFARLGFSIRTIEPVSGDWRYRAVMVPLWFVLTLTAPLSAWTGGSLWRARRRRLRARRGECAGCGYDLRGAAHERCPECGQVVAVAAPV